MRGIARFRSLVAIVGAALFLGIPLLSGFLGPSTCWLLVAVVVFGLVLAFASEQWWVVLPPNRRKRGPLDVRDTDALSDDQFAEWVVEMFARSGGRGLSASHGMSPAVVEGWNADRRRLRAVCICAPGGGVVGDLSGRDFRLDEFGTVDMLLLVTNGSIDPGLAQSMSARNVGIVDRRLLDRWAKEGAILR